MAALCRLCTSKRRSPVLHSRDHRGILCTSRHAVGEADKGGELAHKKSGLPFVG